MEISHLKELIEKKDIIKMSEIKRLIATVNNKKPKYDIHYEFKLPNGLFYNKTQVDTTYGRFLFNVFGLTSNILKHTGYLNIPMNKKEIGRLDNKLAELLLYDDITPDDYYKHVDRMEWFTYNITKLISGSMNTNMSKPLKNIVKKKEEFFKNNPNPDFTEITKLEKELLEEAGEILKNEPGMTTFNSGDAGSFFNNYKNSFVMRGLVNNGDEFLINEKSLSENNDMKSSKNIKSIAADAIIGGGGRALDTAKGGYETKKVLAGYGHIKTGPIGSDCGSKGYLEVTITEKNYKSYEFSYMIEGGKLVRLDRDNKNKYIGKTVKMRSVLFCISNDPCNKCLGDLSYKLGIEYIGNTLMAITANMMMLSMKGFHDSTVKALTINIDEYITYADK